MQAYVVRVFLISIFIQSIPFYTQSFDRVIYPPLVQTSVVNSVASVTALAKKQITFLVYIAGDNSLSAFVEPDLKEMMRVGTNANLNVLAAVHTKQGKTKTSAHYLVMPGKLIQQGVLPTMDSGKVDSVIKAIDWAVKNYPSDMLAIVFWDHGSGAFNRNMTTRACCYDDTTGSFLKDNDLQLALAYAQKLRGGKKTEVVAFDACLMADIEVAFALASYADYLVASQETIPGEGYGYDQILARPSLGRMTPRQFAINTVAAYETVYHGVTADYTLAAIDLSKINKVADNINLLAQQLAEVMKGPDGKIFINALKVSREEKNCTHFEADGHLDLIHFYSNLLGEIQKISVTKPKVCDALIKTLKYGIKIISTAIATRVHGDNYPLAHGLSIYFPGDVLDRTYSSTVWGKQTVWIPFIHHYLSLVV